MRTGGPPTGCEHGWFEAGHTLNAFTRAAARNRRVGAGSSPKEAIDSSAEREQREGESHPSAHATADLLISRSSDKHHRHPMTAVSCRFARVGETVVNASPASSHF